MDDNSPVRFWTPADALVYITKGTGPVFLVEDAIGIDLKIDSPKVPLYGYADRYWAALLPEHIIVYGNL